MLLIQITVNFSMMQVFGNELADKTVMLQDGKNLGDLYNVTMDTETGDIGAVLFELDKKGRVSDRDVPFEEVGGGVYRVPASKVKAIEDCVIVSR